MKKVISILTLTFICGITFGQLVTEKDLKDYGYGANKMKGAPKKVFINEFLVNYQVLSSSTENSAGNKTRAEMAVGLDGIELEDMQQITDNAYALVVKKLEDAGIEIVSPDEAGQNEYYADWQRIEGGIPSQSQLMGYVTTAPNDFDFYVKKVSKKGKNKSGFFDNAPKLSKELGDIPIFETTVNFQFVTIEGSTMINDASKMKGTVNYEMPAAAIAQSAEGMFGAKIETKSTVARFVWKGGAPGAAAKSMIVISPKKGVDIPGVVENKKFKEYVSPDRSYQNSFSGIVISHEKEVVVSHKVKADREAFKQKTQQALNEYLSYVVDEFIANINN